MQNHFGCGVISRLVQSLQFFLQNIYLGNLVKLQKYIEFKYNFKNTLIFIVKRVLDYFHQYIRTLRPSPLLGLSGKNFNFKLMIRVLQCITLGPERNFFLLLFFLSLLLVRETLPLSFLTFLSHDPSARHCKYFLPKPTTNCSVTFIIVVLQKTVHHRNCYNFVHNIFRLLPNYYKNVTLRPETQQ